MGEITGIMPLSAIREDDAGLFAVVLILMGLALVTVAGIVTNRLRNNNDDDLGR